MMSEIEWSDFEQVELRVGTVVSAESFPEARKPAWKLIVDFGPSIGELKTSAQITDLYTPDELIGRQIIGVTNLGKKQIGPFVSEFLLTGFVREDGAVVLAVPDKAINNGAKLA